MPLPRPAVAFPNRTVRTIGLLGATAALLLTAVPVEPAGAELRVSAGISARIVDTAASVRAQAQDCRWIDVDGQRIWACAVDTTAVKATAKAQVPTTTVAKKSLTSAKKKVAPTTTTKPKVVAKKKTTTTKKARVGTTTTLAPASAAQLTAGFQIVSVTDVSGQTQLGVPVTAVVPTTAVAAATTTTVPIPTPFPAAAAAPTRATAATFDPYKGLGAWVDIFDWTVQYGGKTPKFSIATLDKMSAAGVQTVFVQAAKWDGKADVLEPERLLPIIDRSHQLGMQVVVWYLPDLGDVNLDLRRTVAIANLDVDGIAIDIESSKIKSIPDRNQRIVAYSDALRTLLPGRRIGGIILPPVDVDSPTYKLWPQFPYAALAPYYDGWVVMGYWTNRTIDSGWRDAYRYTLENVNRVRAYTGRSDLPIHVIGGVADKVPLTDYPVFLQAASDAGAYGASMYDWITTNAAAWPLLQPLRGLPGVVVPPTTIPAATVPTVPGVVPTDPTQTTQSTQPPIVVPST